MSIWQEIILIAIILILLWLTFRFIRSNPGSFSLDTLSKGFWVLGILALGLIGFIGLLIWLLRS